MESEKRADHEQSCVPEHLRLLLAEVGRFRQRVEGAGEWQEDSGLGLYRAPEEGATPAGATGQPGALEKKVLAMENIMCVLNRELERTALTLEAFNRQHHLDQDKIEGLTNKVLYAYVHLRTYGHTHTYAHTGTQIHVRTYT